jgi:hypothetical protein
MQFGGVSAAINNIHNLVCGRTVFVASDLHVYEDTDYHLLGTSTLKMEAENSSEPLITI